MTIVEVAAKLLKFLLGSSSGPWCNSLSKLWLHGHVGGVGDVVTTVTHGSRGGSVAFAWCSEFGCNLGGVLIPENGQAELEGVWQVYSLVLSEPLPMRLMIYQCGLRVLSIAGEPMVWSRRVRTVAWLPAGWQHCALCRACALHRMAPPTTAQSCLPHPSSIVLAPGHQGCPNHNRVLHRALHLAVWSTLPGACPLCPGRSATGLMTEIAAAPLTTL